MKNAHRRAGHHDGGVSIGRIVPKFRGDLLKATVIAQKLLDGKVENLRVPEEMVAESARARCSRSARRRGGTKTARAIGVIVSPAPGEPGKMPF